MQQRRTDSDTRPLPAEMKAEVMHLLHRRQKNAGVTLQQPMQRCGAALLHAESQKIGQPAAHKLRLPVRPRET